MISPVKKLHNILVKLTKKLSNMPTIGMIAILRDDIIIINKLKKTWNDLIRVTATGILIE